MRYSFISAAVLALVSAVSAQTTDFDPISVPTSATDSVAAGSKYTIKWTSTEKYNGTVTLKLLEGPDAGSLDYATTPIATGIENSANEYTWTIPSDEGSDAVYGIAIFWDSDPTIFQWSFPFTITGASVPSSVSSSAAASTKTVQITTNASYTPTSTFTTSVTSSSPVSNASTSTVEAVVSAASVSGAPTATSNATLSTSGSLKPSSSATQSSSATGTAPPVVTVSSAAVAQIRAGSLAVLGAALAFAL